MAVVYPNIKMKQQNIKKEDWEGFVKELKRLKHPIMPGKSSMTRYEKLIKKYLKGKDILILGSTWQFRDVFKKMKCNVTCVDISPVMLKAHTKLRKTKGGKETLIVGDWLTYKPKKKFDLIMSDAGNFQLPVTKYNTYFRNIKNWLKPKGVSIQMMMADFKKARVSLKEVVSYISKTKTPGNCVMKAYYYLGYHMTKNGNRRGDVMVLDNNLQKFVKKGKISKVKYNLFSLHMGRFIAQMPSPKKLEESVQKYFKIQEKIPHGPSFVEEAFYWQYVLSPK